MTISYRWLSEYLPKTIRPEVLSNILTSIGLEVESLTEFELFKGGLQGLIVGEVLEVVQHPNADKLKLTQVKLGPEKILRIVCGAANVAKGQKVVVAPIGTTIYPKGKEPVTMKLAKIRGEESEGMLCAEDEIGVSDDHEGIVVLDEHIAVGTSLAELYPQYQDWIYEIGLTPNRMDAMSHFGVAKDVCAYLTYHEAPAAPINPFIKEPIFSENSKGIKVVIENKEACKRYAGLLIEGVKVGPSPVALKNKLLAIGLRSINNIVDITNFILHETGQPLHAFDADNIKDQTILVKNYPAGTVFKTLDEKERILTATDLIISDTEKPLCMAGVFGGFSSGVKDSTTRIFLESACFESRAVRKTSLHHGLRTDAATRFEKGVDIAQTVKVLTRAAALIQEIAGGTCSVMVDEYPNPIPKAIVTLSFAYLKKLSGKEYMPEKVTGILLSLGFEIRQESATAIEVAVPYNKPDISLPADLVEEVLRIDGLDHIAIPTAITISPSTDALAPKTDFKNKIANYLVGRGVTEILTNSITNSKYFSEEVLSHSVKMLNNLSADLDVMRPSMLETGLEAIAYNINRKNTSLSFFEMGKVYSKNTLGGYLEKEVLAVYLTGKQFEDSWRTKAGTQDFFVLKGLTQALFNLLGLTKINWVAESANKINLNAGKICIGYLELVAAQKLAQFDIKQAVVYLNIDLLELFTLYGAKKVKYQAVSKFPSIERDLALVIEKTTTYESIEKIIQDAKLDALKDTRLFDLFESEKLGANKKSVAINFVFNAGEKTLTDTEIDAMMQQLMQAFEKNIQAEIRK